VVEPPAPPPPPYAAIRISVPFTTLHGVVALVPFVLTGPPAEPTGVVTVYAPAAMIAAIFVASVIITSK